MQAIDRAHKANGWAGFGYNFAGTDDGSIYEGRGWSKTGAHASGFNDTALGYCWLINGDKRPPTKAAWDAFAGFLLLGLSARVIHKDFWLVGHRRINDQGKSCPGFQTSDQELADLQRWVKAIYANSLKGK